MPVPKAAWSPWTPGVWLMRRAGPGGRAAWLTLAALLPLLALAADHLGFAPLPAPAVFVMALPLLYLWGSARRARAEAADAPGGTVLAQASGESPALAAEMGTERVEPALDAKPIETPASSEPAGNDPQPPGEMPPAPPPADDEAQPMPAPGELTRRLAEVRMAGDELARRTVALAGMLDACTQAVELAAADIESMQDEECVAQKVLVTLRARLMALDHRNHALVSAALAGVPSADDRFALSKAVQAAEGQVLHCHQLSERLGATERGVGRHLESLRRMADTLGRHAERGVREAQQMMVLTRKITASIEAAEAAQPLRTAKPPCA